jgi:hypothetical protein
MIRLLPARPPLARWRRLLASLPNGIPTTLALAISVGVVLAGPGIASSATFADPAGAPHSTPVPAADASATVAPTASPRRDERAATLVRARSGPTALPTAVPTAVPTALPTAVGRATAGTVSSPSSSSPDRGSAAGPTPASLSGILDDGRGTTFGFAIRATTSGPGGDFALISGTHRLDARTVETLAVDDGSATWTGAASWDGIPGYRYHATATDGADAAADRPSTMTPRDRLTVIVWDPRGTVVWGADWPLRSGDIVVHAAASEPDGDVEATVAVLSA